MDDAEIYAKTFKPETLAIMISEAMQRISLLEEIRKDHIKIIDNLRAENTGLNEDLCKCQNGVMKYVKKLAKGD